MAYEFDLMVESFDLFNFLELRDGVLFDSKSLFLNL